VRAAIVERYGPARDVLRVVDDLPIPEPGHGEVRVRVRLSGINPSDWRVRSGSLAPAPAHPFVVPHQDGAGEIDAVGPGVPPKRIGQRVWIWFAGANGRRWGTASEWVCLPSEQAVPLPASASLELGACLGIPALTAHRCLDAGVSSRRGAMVLVAGGAGAVGHFAIELARRMGAHVIATARSDEKARLARAAGAELVVDPRDDDAAQQIRAHAPDGVDRIVEVAPAANVALDLAVAAQHGVIAAYATDGELSVPTPALLHANLTLRFLRIYDTPPMQLVRHVAGVSAAVRAGQLTPLPIHRFALADIAAAHEAVEAGVTGKVVVAL
jgi:NADPH2:quinone reductase